MAACGKSSRRLPWIEHSRRNRNQIHLTARGFFQVKAVLNWVKCDRSKYKEKQKQRARGDTGCDECECER